jgi:hypothetical protein
LSELLIFADTNLDALRGRDEAERFRNPTIYRDFAAKNHRGTSTDFRRLIMTSRYDLPKSERVLCHKIFITT